MSDSSAPGPRDLLATAVLGAVVALAAAIGFHGVDIATGERLFFTHDIELSDLWHLNYPAKSFYQESLAGGRLPLWCPYVGTGFPLHAEGQVAALYPPNLLLFALLPLALAFNGGILLHGALAGGFAAAYARQLGVGRPGAVLCAVTFSLAGFFVTHLKHVNMVAAAVWIPLILLLLERQASRRRFGTAAALAAVVGIDALAGHPNTLFNNLLVAGAYAAYLALRTWRREGRRRAARLVAVVGSAVAIGLALGGPQLVPTWELNRHGPRRAGLSLEDATRWEYQWKHLAAFVAPGAFGDPGRLREEPAEYDGRPAFRLRGFEQDPERPIHFWEITGYVGLVPLGLFAVAVALGHRRRALRVCAALAGGSLLMALGKNGGLFYVAWYLVPGFRLFRFHDRFLLYADLALAVGAGFGMTLLAERLGGARRRRLAAGLAATLAVLVFVDIRSALGDHNPKISAARWTDPPPVVRAIRSSAPPGVAPPRVATHDPEHTVFQNAYVRARGWKGDLTPYDVARNVLDPNYNVLFGIGSLDLYYKLYPQWMMDLARAGSAGALSPAERLAARGRVEDLYNVGHVIEPAGSVYRAGAARSQPKTADWPGNRLLTSFPGDVSVRAARNAAGEPVYVELPPFRIDLYENRDALPRAFLVPHAAWLEPPAALERLLDPEFDPRREVLLSAPATASPPADDGPGPPIDTPVTLIEYGAQRIRLSVEAPRAAWLFLGDTWYPGWRAAVNGRGATVYRANVAGRAIRVPRGAAEIVFAFAPRSLLVGWGTAIAGLLALVAWGWLGPGVGDREAGP